MTGLLTDLRTLYLTGEEIVVAGVPKGIACAVVRTAAGRTYAGRVANGEVRFGGIPSGTHAVELYGPHDELIAEQFVCVRDNAGQDPILGFATSFDRASVSQTLDWLRELRCTVVQIYDWMESYSKPLGPPGAYRDALGREIDRIALEQLVIGIRAFGAVAHAYAPVYAADPGTHEEWRLYRNDGAPESLGELLEIMDPRNRDWQEEWLRQYGEAADALGFNGFHLDTYGHPRSAVNAAGEAVPMADAYASFIGAVRRVRPRDVISFNQVNGVPAGIAPPPLPGFRYVEVWPPNDRWRHLEALMARSTGPGAEPYGDTLAIYPPVWNEPRPDALRTVILTEAIATALGIGTLMFGDTAAVLRHPYYVDHERFTPEEARKVIAWHRFGLRCRDLFRCGEDTSWFELEDENAAVTVTSDVPARPEPEGGVLFTRVRHTPDSIVVSMLDLSGSRDGSWSAGSRAGTCSSAVVTALVERPERWSAHTAVLGQDGDRFTSVPLSEGTHREGRAVICNVPIADGWSVLRLENTER